MQLFTIRSGSNEELEQKKYNIGVGISLGNKWFTPEHILELVQWSLRYTKEYVVVYVADSIHALNIEARTGKNPSAAKRSALKLGNEILNAVKDNIDTTLNAEDQNKIVYAHWEELLDEHYQKKVAYLYSFFEDNETFKECILSLVKEHTSQEERIFSEEALRKMAQYILEEIPECLARVQIGGILVDAYTYPFDGALTLFIEKLQKGELFPEIKKEILDTEPKVLLVVR